MNYKYSRKEIVKRINNDDYIDAYWEVTMDKVVKDFLATKESKPTTDRGGAVTIKKHHSTAKVRPKPKKIGKLSYYQDSRSDFIDKINELVNAVNNLTEK